MRIGGGGGGGDYSTVKKFFLLIPQFRSCNQQNKEMATNNVDKLFGDFQHLKPLT